MTTLLFFLYCQSVVPIFFTPNSLRPTFFFVASHIVQHSCSHTHHPTQLINDMSAAASSSSSSSAAAAAAMPSQSATAKSPAAITTADIQRTISESSRDLKALLASLLVATQGTMAAIESKVEEEKKTNLERHRTNLYVQEDLIRSALTTLTIVASLTDVPGNEVFNKFKQRREQHAKDLTERYKNDVEPELDRIEAAVHKS
jgi:hypothetical protein